MAHVASMNSQRFPVQKEVWKNAQKTPKKHSPVYLTVKRYQQQPQQVSNSNLFNISETEEERPATPTTITRPEIKTELVTDAPPVAQTLTPRPSNAILTTEINNDVVAFTQSVKLVCDAINSLNQTIAGALQRQSPQNAPIE